MNADETQIAADEFRHATPLTLSAGIGVKLSAFIGAFKAVVG
jgi:hypothetical protein